MENECYLRLQPIISEFPHLHRFLDDGFVSGQCESGLKCYILRGSAGLVNGWTVDDFEQHLPTLEKRLAQLASVNGYNRLKPLLRGAVDWDKYEEVLAQIDITLWFKDKDIIKGIEPELPHRKGYGDVVLYFSQQDIYCEVNSFESLARSIESKTEQDVKNELKIKRTVRNLLDKTKRQLPPNYPGLLALETVKAVKFHHEIREVACRIFPKRPQIALIMLWSGEFGTKIGEPPFWFVNPSSPYQNIGQELLKYLGQDNKVLDCG